MAKALNRLILVGFDELDPNTDSGNNGFRHLMDVFNVEKNGIKFFDKPTNPLEKIIKDSFIYDPSKPLNYDIGNSLCLASDRLSMEQRQKIKFLKKAGITVRMGLEEINLEDTTESGLKEWVQTGQYPKSELNKEEEHDVDDVLDGFFSDEESDFDEELKPKIRDNEVKIDSDYKSNFEDGDEDSFEELSEAIPDGEIDIDEEIDNAVDDYIDSKEDNLNEDDEIDSILDEEEELPDSQNVEDDFPDSQNVEDDFPKDSASDENEDEDESFDIDNMFSYEDEEDSDDEEGHHNREEFSKNSHSIQNATVEEDDDEFDIDDYMDEDDDDESILSDELEDIERPITGVPSDFNEDEENPRQSSSSVENDEEEYTHISDKDDSNELIDKFKKERERVAKMKKQKEEFEKNKRRKEGKDKESQPQQSRFTRSDEISIEAQEFARAQNDMDEESFDSSGRRKNYRSYLSPADEREQRISEKKMQQFGDLNDISRDMLPKNGEDAKRVNSGQGRVVLVTSGKGGVGKSMVSSALASALSLAKYKMNESNATGNNKRTWLIESDYTNPQMAITFSTGSKSIGNVSELIMKGEDDITAIRNAIEDNAYIDEATGVTVLACPTNTASPYAEEVPYAIVRAIRYAAITLGDDVIIDHGNLTSGTYSVIDSTLATNMAHRIVLVADMHCIPETHNVLQMLTRGVPGSVSTKINPTAVSIVLNQARQEQYQVAQKELAPFPIVGILPPIDAFRPENSMGEDSHLNNMPPEIRKAVINRCGKVLSYIGWQKEGKIFGGKKNISTRLTKPKGNIIQRILGKFF